MKTLTILISTMLLVASAQVLAQTEEETEKVERTGTRLKIFEPIVTTTAEKPAGKLDTSELDDETAAILEAAAAAEKSED